MSVELIVEPRKTYTWKQFIQDKPPFSIALDGFVNAKTKRFVEGPYANFDHHYKSDRLATRSTSEQVMIEVHMGLFEVFQKNKEHYAKIYVNDCDEDTCLAYWLLRYFPKISTRYLFRVNRLVYCEDRLDSTAGSYPFLQAEFRKQMAWIFEPYYIARFSGKLSHLDAKEMEKIIESVCQRITAHVLGDQSQLSLKGTYKRLGGGKNWAMVKESGPYSRAALFSNHVNAFVSLLSIRPDGSFVYTIGRTSVWIPFDILKLYKELNKQEKVMISKNNRWGGSDTIGGSPRETGSSLSPKEVERIINVVLKTK
jgi:hypothetical protein